MLLNLGEVLPSKVLFSSNCSCLDLLLVGLCRRINGESGIGGDRSGVSVASGSGRTLVAPERHGPVVVGERSGRANLVAVADGAALIIERNILFDRVVIGGCSLGLFLRVVL